MPPRKTRLLSLILAALFPGLAAVYGQPMLRATVWDNHSAEPVPFASVQFLRAGSGTLTDSAGRFVLPLPSADDTLLVTYVGYQDYRLPVDSSLVLAPPAELQIFLERGKYTQEVVVTRKIDRGLLMWRRIVRRKPYNDRYRFSNFGYELYNKLQLDIRNLDKERLQDLRVLQKFRFVFDYFDSSGGATLLPAYLTETLSDYYFQRSPLRRREVIRASKTLGIKNESLTRFLGGMDQNVNIYSNFIPVFDKSFVSPLSDNGDAYYRYRVLDSQFVGGRRLIHMSFTPRRKGENTFEGDLWVHDTTFAVQKMNLRLSEDADLNFVRELSLVQEYSMVGDSIWFLSKDKFVVDLAPLGASSISFIGRKTTTYRNVRVNDPAVEAELDRNRIMEEVILASELDEQPETFWEASRHEALSETEAGIYRMVDTLLSSPSFRRTRDNLAFLTTGYRNIGNYEIGPWYNWISYNTLEGLRYRFDLGTNNRFSKKWYLHGYAAYGTVDKRWKFQLDAMHLFSKLPRQFLRATYKRDIDFGQTYYDQISQDNIFALAIRKTGVPIKFMFTDEKKLEYFTETRGGLSFLTTALHKQFEPLRNLPPAPHPNQGQSAAAATVEASVRIRYAALEKFFETSFNRFSLGSPYPVAELKLTRGISGLAQSEYDYWRLNGSLSYQRKLPPFGSLYLNLFGGRSYGELPYMLLDIAPGNELYYYNKYAFNLMNRYEFVHDRYAGANFEHNIGSGLLRYVPGLRKLRLRQFYSARTLWGSLSPENRSLNTAPGLIFPFEALDGKTYLEIGTGIDNILRLFRIEFIWRLAPRPLPAEHAKRFGVFGSFRLGF